MHAHIHTLLLTRGLEARTTWESCISDSVYHRIKFDDAADQCQAGNPIEAIALGGVHALTGHLNSAAGPNMWSTRSFGFETF